MLHHASFERVTLGGNVFVVDLILAPALMVHFA